MDELFLESLILIGENIHGNRTLRESAINSFTIFQETGARIRVYGTKKGNGEKVILFS
jgi:hypothetical protein